jgi:hypothetical protein
MKLRHLALAAALVFAAPAGAVEPPPGSKNFNAPGYVPNYFSNESGPFGGGGARAPAAPVVAAPAGAAPATITARAVGRAHAARHVRGKQGATRLARGKGGRRRQIAHASRGRAVASRQAVASHAAKPAKAIAVRVAHAQPRAAVKSRPAAARSKPSGRGHG